MRKMFVLMVALAILAVPAFAQNLLVNGDFETGDTTGWTTWGAPWGGPYNNNVVDSPVHGGDWALNLNAGYGSFGVVQAINVNPGTTYKISGYWMGTGISHWVEVLFFNDDGRALYDQLDAPANSSVITKIDGWGMNGQTIAAYESLDAGRWFPSGLFTTEIMATAPVMYVGFKAGTVGGLVDANFDDFSVVAVPEPSSLLALMSGIGALGFGLRRRTR